MNFLTIADHIDHFTDAERQLTREYDEMADLHARAIDIGVPFRELLNLEKEMNTVLVKRAEVRRTLAYWERIDQEYPREEYE